MDDFKHSVWEFYAGHARTMPWRDMHTFYYVLVSEIMLQQTQVVRVIPKFNSFIKRFPDIGDLARASLADVLEQWVGLGYNRRAKYLYEAGKYVCQNGQPDTLKAIMALPGVGKNTAAAIMNYVYNVPTPFIETNIRTVYIYHFFPGHINVTDGQIADLVAATMDAERPREWFWALMDYGAYLKSKGPGGLSASRHYKKQSPLMGSVRQMRGWIIGELAAGSKLRSYFEEKYANDPRYTVALHGLIRDGLIDETNNILHLTK